MNITNNKRYLYLDGKSEISIELDTCPFLKNKERKQQIICQLSEL